MGPNPPVEQHMPVNPHPGAGFAGGVHGIAPGAPLHNPGLGNPQSAHHGFISSVLAALMAAHHGIIPPPGLPQMGGGLSEGLNGPPPALNRVDPGALGLGEHYPALPPVAPQGNDRAGDITHMPGYAQQTGNAQLWEQRHPYAVAHGNIPNWVTQALLAAIQAHMPAQHPNGQGSGINPVSVL